MCTTFVKVSPLHTGNPLTGFEVKAVFCNMSKAFDRVWHRGLLYKLKSAGISGSLLSWFKDYLKGRKQRVVLPGSASSGGIY